MSSAGPLGDAGRFCTVKWMEQGMRLSTTCETRYRSVVPPLRWWREGMPSECALDWCIARRPATRRQSIPIRSRVRGRSRMDAVSAHATAPASQVGAVVLALAAAYGRDRMNSSSSRQHARGAPQATRNLRQKSFPSAATSRIETSVAPLTPRHHVKSGSRTSGSSLGNPWGAVEGVP